MTEKKKPAFPPAPNELKAPAFGWVCNPDRLTGNELEQVRQASGLDPLKVADNSEAARVGLYVALAYARRLHPSIPWERALDIPMGALTIEFPDDEDDGQDEHAKAVEAAILAGEEPPNPS